MQPLQQIPQSLPILVNDSVLLVFHFLLHKVQKVLRTHSCRVVNVHVHFQNIVKVLLRYFLLKVRFFLVVKDLVYFELFLKVFQSVVAKTVKRFIVYCV